MEPTYKKIILDDVCCYHFGYVKPLKKVREKLDYYSRRNIEKIVEPDTYKVWSKLEDKTQPTQNVRSWAIEVKDIQLPKILKTHKFAEVEDVRR